MPPSEQQIREALLAVQQGRKGVRQFCREFGISPPTYYRWRTKYGAVSRSELERLREENDRLTRLLVERDLEVYRLREALERSEAAQDETEAWFST